MYESFSHSNSFEVESEGGALSKLKRFFVSGSLSTPLPTVPPTPLETPSPSPIVPDLDVPTPLPKYQISADQQAPYHPLLPNGSRRVRSIRLSGVAPSPRLTAANSLPGDLVQSGSSSSINGDYRFGSEFGGLGSSIYGSPSLLGGDALTSNHLSSIPGFPLGRDGADDSKSIRSVMTTATRPSTTAAHIIRRLRGEGLSKEYWIRDESSKECFACQTVFAVYRRKHHCRICGQIFCSRCASNIISSQRFGSKGYVRVCNLCLSIMEDGDPAPDEPPPSRSRAGLRNGSPLTISAPIEASARPPQSQFAASHLFPRIEQPYNFPPDSTYGGRDSVGSTRAGSPLDFFDEEDEENPKRPLGSPLIFSTTRSNSPPPPSTSIAPFRRGLHGDDKGSEDTATSGLGISGSGEMGEDEVRAKAIDQLEAENGAISEDAPSAFKLALDAVEANSNSTSPVNIAASTTQTSPPLPPSIRFSPTIDIALSSSRSPGTTRSRAKSTVSFRPNDSGFPSIIYPNLPDEEDTLGLGPDPRDLQRILAASGPYRDLPTGEIELSDHYLEHIRRMLRQNLTKAGIPNIDPWEKVIIKLLGQVAKLPCPNIRGGDDIDIRSFIRVKKIPGGSPRDSEYVSGVVFTKNVLHKQMARHLTNPRIMLFSFPLEYQRVENQLMSLEPLLKQEREYLKHLVDRIVALRPHVILVQRNVSRLALEYLMKANVAVARNVKPEVMEAVSRATQADIIASMDKLALEPRLGRCGTFQVQTFVHSMIPGRRKTFMRFEDCQQELGGTLVLRGGTLETLTKVKKIVDLMLSGIYSAKLEGYLIRDERVVPSDALDLVPYSAEVGRPEALLANLNTNSRDNVSRDIALSLRPYQETILSTTPSVRYLPPYPLLKMSEVDRRATALQRLREYEETEQIIHEEEISRKEASTISASSSVHSLSSLVIDGRSRASSIAEKPTSSIQEDAMRVLQTPHDVARLSEFAEAEEQYVEQLVLWETYVERNKNSLDPVDHQQLYVLETFSCSQTQQHCVAPFVRSITFYGKDDLSIGQYIEKFVRDAGKACPLPSCGRHMIVHFRTWVHRNMRVIICSEAYHPNLASAELEGEIIMHGYCIVCKKSSAQTAMSEETYKFSFGKYLELCFYPEGLVQSENGCEHTAHSDHVRFWMYRGMSIQITTEEIPLLNVVLPPLSLRIKPEHHLRLRNEEYITVLNKSTAFWDSIDHRIATFNFDLVQADRVEESRKVMEEMSRKCDVDRRMILKLLQSTYEQSSETNGNEMTAVRRTLVYKGVEWETEFTAFEQKLISTEDIRRLTATQLKRLFKDGGLPLSQERKAATSGLDPPIESDEKECASTLEGGVPLTLEQLSRLDPNVPYSTINSISSVSSSVTDSSSILDTSSAQNVIETSATSSGGESDSTARGHPTTAAVPIIPPSPWVIRKVSSTMEDTSEAESDLERTPARQKKPGKVVGALVSFYSDGADSPPSDRKISVLSPRSPSSGKPLLRKGVSDRSRIPRLQADVFSDNDGYAKNVGVSHLAGRNFAERPSKIPATVKATALSQLFEEPNTRRPRISRSPQASPSVSRSVSRAGSITRTGSISRSGSISSRPSSRAGRHTPSISAHRVAAEGSATTIKGKSATTVTGPSKASVKGKAKEPGTSRKGDGSPEKKPARGKLGVDRPTASSTNKGVTARRVVSGSSNPGHRVSTIANHFNKLADRDREHQKKMALFRGRHARAVAVARPTVEVFDNVKDAVMDDSGDESSDGADDEYDDDGGEVETEGDLERDRRDPSTASSKESFIYEPVRPTLSIANALLQIPGTPPAVATPAPSPVEPASRMESADSSTLSSQISAAVTDTAATFPRISEGESSGNERGSLRRAFSNFWGYRGAEFSALEYPLHASEHIFATNSILVREDEPSSILAFTLSSKEYRNKLEEEEPSGPAIRVVERSESFMPDEIHPADRSSTWGLLDIQVDGNAFEETLKKPGGKHFRLHFEEGTTKFSCNIFFAEQFDALRKNCGCETQFIESLARCVKWESSGGRSNADFLKTLDDRFIVKEISKPEMDSLLRFAPAYFEYMSKAFFHGLPTILAKIYGFYTISLKNTTTGKTMRIDVLVMENLFYGRQLSQIFDLKGSTRNRHVQVSKDPKRDPNPYEVLMDENLIEISYKEPIYIREASKKSLKSAVFNDSSFLSESNVMDYSLIVGVDATKGELVVGIVDFIRTYTWDKKVENWVKDSVLGAGSRPGGPTIVTPKQYKARFREAMDSYLLVSPDPWIDRSLVDKRSTFT